MVNEYSFEHAKKIMVNGGQKGRCEGVFTIVQLRGGACLGWPGLAGWQTSWGTSVTGHAGCVQNAAQKGPSPM